MCFTSRDACVTLWFYKVAFHKQGCLCYYVCFTSRDACVTMCVSQAGMLVLLCVFHKQECLCYYVCFTSRNACVTMCVSQAGMLEIIRLSLKFNFSKR